MFPAGEGNTLWVVGTCGALAVAGVAAIWIAVRLMKVARPVFLDETSPRPADDNSNPEGLDGKERKAILPVYTQAAGRFGFQTLPGLAQRERALRRATAQAVGKEERARRGALADDVKTEIEQALARAQLVVIRRRAVAAVSDFGAFVLYCAVITGLIFFAVGADKVSSDRPDPVANAKACGDARTAGATAGELKRTDGVCDAKADQPVQPAETPSAAQARSQIAEKLAAAVTACTALTATPNGTAGGPLTNADCDPVRQALAAMSSGGP